MRRVVITALVAGHLAASLWHGNLHTQLGIDLATWQTLFVVIVILIGPVVGAALVWTRYASTGLWLFFVSMLGAFVFGVYHHYMMVSADNIHYLPGANAELHHGFTISAGVIALLELVSALYGAFLLGRGRPK